MAPGVGFSPEALGICGAHACVRSAHTGSRGPSARGEEAGVRQRLRKFSALTIDAEKSSFTFAVWPASHRPPRSLFFSEVGQET